MSILSHGMQQNKILLFRHGPKIIKKAVFSDSLFLSVDPRGTDGSLLIELSTLELLGNSKKKSIMIPKTQTR